MKTAPREDFTPQETQRYSRNALLAQVGWEGQVRWGAGRVLVVGAGGIGSAALLYLAAAGVGRLGLVDGDAVELKLPMRVVVRKWEKNKDAVSVDRGPLSYSLVIEERWQKYGPPAWPEWEVFPASAWNYGLALDPADPAKSLEVVRKPGPVPVQPWTPATAPMAIRAKARKIPNWTVDRLDLVGPLQASPARTEEPIETVTLIPMGAARLRIATFPTTTSGSEGH